MTPSKGIRSCSILTTIFLLFINLVILTPKTSYSEAARSRLKNTLEIQYNYGCSLKKCTENDPDKSSINLFQVLSTNPETPQRTNIMWSNIGGPPMVITTSTSQQSNLHIDWQSIVGPDPEQQQNNTNSSSPSASPSRLSQFDGFHFNVTQDAAIGLLVEKIVLFDDVDKSGLFTKDKPHVEIDWGQVIWDQASRTVYNKDDFLKSHMRMKVPHKIFGGTLLFKLGLPRNHRADRQQESPHLKMNHQSVSLVIIADGMQPPPTFKNARLAMTLVVIVQTPSSQVSLDTDSESLISDEYTPGVFRIKSLQFKTKQDSQSGSSKVDDGSTNPYVDIEAQTPEAQQALMQTSTLGATEADKTKLGFLYWKEVAYTDRRKMISRTVDVYDNEVSMPMDTLPSISQPFYQYFKYQPEVGPKPQHKLYRFEMIFGKGESTYGSTNYTDFSFVFGLGAAPQEQMFSFLVKFIIFICFCLPLLVMLAGVAYLLLRRFRRNGDTELLLAAES